MSVEDIKQVVREHRDAARRASDAGVDGVKVHNANGYFLHIRNASAGSRILSIGKTGLATGPSFDEKGRSFR